MESAAVEKKTEKFLGIFLQIVAAVLGIIQVAHGLQIIYNSLREILK